MADRLEDLLRDCTVRVTGGPMAGAGFFVAPGMVVTCAHVVGSPDDAHDLQVHWERDGRPPQVAAVLPRITRLADRGPAIPALEAGYPDIAVLRILGLDGHPCVDIDTEWPAQHDSFQVFGYPREGGAIRLTPARLSYRGVNGTLPTAYLDLASDTIKPGMSGAAVLNLRTGAVCGIVVASKNTARPDGALAVPWSVVAADLGEVLAANQKFQRTDPRWRDAYRHSQAPERAHASAEQQARLQSYLSAARSAARQHPYAIKVAGVPSPPLSTVYLRQQLGAQVDQAQLASADGAGTDEADHGRFKDPATGVTVDVIREALQRFDIDDLLRHNDGALITGGPGSGKSSLMRHIVEMSADSWSDAVRPEFVPVLVHARVLLVSLPVNQAIATALRHDLGTRLDDIDLDSLFAGPPMPGLPWLILLDGLDEIFELERRQQVVDIITRWWGDPRYRFLITSRPLPERELHLLRSAGIPAFEIQAFTDDQLPELARRWFHALPVSRADEMVDLFIAQVRRAQMAHLARNPLIATISCVVFADNPDRELPYSRADLYREFIRLFLEKVSAQREFLSSISERLGRYSPQGPRAAAALVIGLPTLIQELAVARFTGSDVSLRATAEQLAASYRPSAVPQNAWQQILTELLLRSGLLSERAGDLTFAHETIVEYLAAAARTAPSRPGRLGSRERWLLATQAGSSQSYALFVAALLRERGIDLTDRAPAVLQVRKLLHARLVAALVHDGCVLRPEVVTAAARCLARIATEKTTGIPDVLRRGIWEDDDCVLAAKALTLIDREQGLDLLFTLAADPAVPSFSVFDALAETMVREDLSEIDSARGLAVLYRVAATPSAAGVVADSQNRMLIVDLMLDRDPELGTGLLKTLARDSSMDLLDRYKCIERLAGIDRQNAVDALVGIITDTNNSLQSTLYTYPILYDLDQAAAVSALARAATDRARSGYFRAVTGWVLYRDARPQGVRVFRELSADLDVYGFHRVYHFAEFGDSGTRASRLLELSRDATLPARWRIFAAEELWEDEHEAGLAALHAIRKDVCAGWRVRVKLGIRIFTYERTAKRPELLNRWWRSASRLIWAENLLREEGALPASVLKYLMPHELMINARRSHPARLLVSFVLLLCSTVAAAVLSVAFPQHITLAIIWSAWTLILLNLIRSVLEWSNSYTVLTSQRLLVVWGIMIRKVAMVPKGSGGTERYFERSLFGRIFGYGTLIFRGSRSIGLMRVKNVLDPGSLYDEMLTVARREEVERRPGVRRDS